MELFEAIHTRRSIRKFKQTAVGEQDVRDILAAAMMAPSAGNEQPWHFVVLTERAKLDAVTAFHAHAAMAAHAPLGILVCGDLNLEKYSGFWVQDCAAAMQNLLLATHAKGLGAVWVGIYPVQNRIEGFRSLLGLPEPVIPFGLAVIGYPDQNLTARDRYRPDRVHRNQW
jgi:nitroreductase